MRKAQTLAPRLMGRCQAMTLKSPRPGRHVLEPPLGRRRQEPILGQPPGRLSTGGAGPQDLSLVTEGRWWVEKGVSISVSGVPLPGDAVAIAHQESRGWRLCSHRQLDGPLTLVRTNGAGSIVMARIVGPRG